LRDPPPAIGFGNRSGVTDALTCGAGEDEAQATRADRVATDCEHVYFGGTPLPRPAIAATASLRALRGRPRGVLARARLVPFSALGTAALRLRLSRLATRALACRGTIRMRLEISARDAEGNASITRRIVVVRR
jgi:hypothetical protein